MKFTGVKFEKRGHKGTRVVETFSRRWTEADVLDVFGSDAAESKHAQQLFSCTTYFDGFTRGNAGLNSVTAAVLDCDYADVGALDSVSSYLRAKGLTFVAYTSWSHGSPDKEHASGKKGPFDSFRIVLPYSREVSPAEHRVIIPALFGHEVPADPEHYAKEVAGKWKEAENGRPYAIAPRGWDPGSSSPSRGYFMPSAKSSIDFYPGAPLYVDDILQRETTARPSQRSMRQYQTPDAAAVGALARIVDQLSKITDVEGKGYEGWHRAACPACAPSGTQRSPSFTVRANGDGVDVHCHSCRAPRKDLLGALGLSSTGSFAPPSELRLLVDEQLALQPSSAEAVPVNVAVSKLVVDIREALAARERTIVKYPAGTGKSFASAKVLAEYAAQGYRLAYSTQEHVVAHETRSLLPPQVKARSVHIHSPLIQVGDGPVCQRADELKERVFEFGVSLLGSVCPRCPHRLECAAFSAAKQRAKDLPHASVVFVSHAGIQQLFREEEGGDLMLVVDEMPGAFECVSVSRAELKTLAAGVPLYSADQGCAALAATIARAWCVGATPGKVQWGYDQKPVGDAVELSLEWGRLLLRGDAHPRAEERPRLKAADALIRLCAHKARGGHVEGIGAWEQGDVAAMLPVAAHQALVRHNGVLLSATPFLPALPDFKLRECEVTDGAKVARKMVVRSQRGSKALTHAYYDDDAGKRQRREREPGEEPGIPWPVVDAAITRALREADKYECKRVLFVSFKAVTDAIREHGVPANVELAHYGALRGKNDWQERASKECSVAYLLGAPRFAIMPTLRELKYYGEAATQAWVQYAAGELTQAEGRLRLPRRTKPCTIFVEGDVAPSDWHAGSVDEWIEDDYIETPSAVLEGALLWYTQAEIAEALGKRYARGQPARPEPQDVPALSRLSLPEAADGVAMLAEMPPGRRKTHDELFSWASGLDDG